jgi:HEAT repeat protein
VLAKFSWVRELLERILNVRPGEWMDLLFFWTFNTFLWTGLCIGEAVSEALFLKKIGVELLPHMFVICSLVSIPLTVMLSALQSRLGSVKVAILLGFAATVMVLVCVGLIHYSLAFGYPFLYVVTNAFTTLLATHFSILLSGHFSTLDAKRLVPLILSGSVSGAIIGGAVLHNFSQRIGVENLLLIWVFLLISSLAWFLLFSMKVFPAAWNRESAESLPKYVSGGTFDRLLYEGRAVFQSPLLLLLAVSTLLMTMSRYFIEFQYSDIFNTAFPDESQLAAFFGKYVILANVAALLFQGLVTGRMIQAIGVSNANLFFPFTTLLAFAGVGIWYSVPAGVFARFNQEGLRKCVSAPVTNLLYNAIPAKQRVRSIAFNEGIVVPIGSVVAGLVLMYLKDHPSIFFLTSLVLAGVWLSLNWWQRGVYSQSLLDLLKRSQLENIQSQERDIGILDEKTQALVIESLSDTQDEVVELAADLLLIYGRPNARLALLRQAVNSRDSAKRLLIGKLPRYATADVKRFLLKSLQDPNDEVKLAGLEALISFPQDQEIRDRLGEFLEYEDTRHQTVAAAGVVRGGDLVQMMKALLVLQKYLYSPNATEAVMGINALGRTRDERFWVNLRPYLSHNSGHLRLAAVRAMESLVQVGEVQDHLEVLEELLHDPVREIRSLAIQIIGRVRNEFGISLLQEALGDASPRNRRLALEALAGLGADIVPDLLMILDDPHAPLAKQEGAVKLLGLSQDPHIRDRLTRFALEKIRLIYQLKADELIVVKELMPDEGEFLRMNLAEKANGVLRLIVGLLTPEADVSAAKTVVKNLYSTNQEVTGNAIEVLQTMGERTLIYHILPVLEGLPLAQIVAYGKRVFSVGEGTLRMVLGRYLVTLDRELKEAAIFTIGKIQMRELLPAVKKILESEGKGGFCGEVCRYALEHFGVSAVSSDPEPSIVP